MDITVKGIVLKTQDYKDSDRLLTILTLEKGKILVKARGVKKAKSKFKAFCQSFCFAEFELVSGNGGYILTGVNEIENFYNLTADIEKFSFAFCVLELLDKICMENQEYVKVFVEALKCLQQMSYSNLNSKFCLIKFFINVLYYEGFNINLNKCTCCKTPLVSSLYFDFNKGEILCSACKTFDSIELENSVFSTLKIISGCDYEKLQTVKIKENILDKTLSILIKNLHFKYDITLKSLTL